MATKPSTFPTGVVIFFRSMTPDNNMARSIHQAARYIRIGDEGDFRHHADDYVVLDEDRRVLGVYPREFVSAILPLEIVPEQPKEINVGNVN